MIKYIAVLMISIMPLCAESIDEMKKRFMDEIEKCGAFTTAGITCQLKINNKLMLLFLIEQMKERFMDEIEACDEPKGIRLSDYRIKCQLKVNNKLMLLFLVEQMKESKK